MAAKSSTKKRPPPPHSSASSQPHAPNAKRQKTLSDRKLAAQTSSSAFNGEIDLSSFVKAREFEIRALEEGIQRSKKALSSRAFQEVPRELRRRQASHNAKRVPGRLRGRAMREMVEDNTPTVSSRTRKKSGRARLRLDTARKLHGLGKSTGKKADIALEVKVTAIVDDAGEATAATGEGSPKNPKNINVRKPRVKKTAVVAKPPTPPAKFRKRQINKSWLPTHMYHTKRARMTNPKEPLWRYAIPLSPSVKSYRPTHRASTLRGAVAWDMSYMATISLEGVEASIKNLLRALGVGERESIWGRPGRKWRAGLRAWHGWLYEREAYPYDAIAPTTILWCPAAPDKNATLPPQSDVPAQAAAAKRKVFVRVHPAGFFQAWEQIVRLSKVQKPSVAVEDLRFEIGSIEITGPAATEALTAVLWPTPLNAQAPSSADATWPKLSSLNNCASLPKDVIISFAAADPRLHHPPRRTPSSSSCPSEAEMLDLLTTWPLDTSPPPASALFSRSARTTATRSLPSQKSINRRKSTLKHHTTHPTPLPTDPKIPILLFTRRNPTHNGQGSWTLLAPWKCILPIWYSLMHYPVSTGGNPRFGGLDEVRQLAFESGTPWFPGDYPGTAAGDTWQRAEDEKRQREWARMPKGKRVEWSTLDLGRGRKGEVGVGWACDWDALRRPPPPQDSTEEEPAEPPKQFRHIPTHTLPTTSPTAPNLTTSLCTVTLTLLARGSATACARIYRLPTTNPQLRQSWLKLVPDSPGSSRKKAKTDRIHRHIAALPQNAPAHERRARLAHVLLTEQQTRPGDGEEYPAVPDAVDLIGFVTTGNYNLCEGKATAIGSVLVSRVLPLGSEEGEEGAADVVEREGGRERDREKEGRLCIVRNAGQMVGRLARWDVV